jgi:hypothetical protein
MSAEAAIPLPAPRLYSRMKLLKLVIVGDDWEVVGEESYDSFVQVNGR